MIIILIVGDHHTRCWACSRSSKAEAAIAALQEIAAATSKVMRDGKMVILKSEDLVPGDVVILEAGDAVPADGRIIECASMKIEEAALTGESVPVNKLVKVPEPGRGEGYSPGRPEKHDVHGSTVVYGRGKAVITGTGMDTEMGKIASALSEAKEDETPLQKKLTQLSKILTVLVVRHLRGDLRSGPDPGRHVPGGHYGRYDSGYLHGGGVPGCGSHTGRTGGGGDHRAVHRRYQHVPAQCHYPEADRGGDPGLHPDYLFR